jgi:hypothetical protein
LIPAEHSLRWNEESSSMLGTDRETEDAKIVLHDRLNRNPPMVSITLKSGLAVSFDSLQVLWALESRGLEVTLEAGGLVLAVGPRALITEDDREKIRAHRDELLALVTYSEVM